MKKITLFIFLVNSIPLFAQVPPTPTITAQNPPSASSTCYTTLTATGCAVGQQVEWINTRFGNIYSTTNPLVVSSNTPVELVARCKLLATPFTAGQLSNKILSKAAAFTEIIGGQYQYICTANNILLNASSAFSGLTYQWKSYGSNIDGETNSSIVTNQYAGFSVEAKNGSCTYISNSIYTQNGGSAALPTNTTTQYGYASTSGVPCNVIAAIVPSGINPITLYNSVTCVTWVPPGPIQANANSASREMASPITGPLVGRHYQLTPNGGSNFSATITLYFSQADFDAYNLIVSAKIPTNATDANGKANLRILKVSGTATDADGLDYGINPVTTSINPDDSKIVFQNGRWEITFDITSFSGFFVNSTNTPLPITLVNFSANPVSKGNQLKWQTSNEKNFSHFEIERSQDGRKFRKIGSVIGSQSENYEFLDKTEIEKSGATPAKSEISYYRLKQVDLDGKFEYSKIISVVSDEIIEIKVFPNPVSDILTIENSKNKSLNLNLSNASGNSLTQLQNATDSQIKMNIKSVPSGIYFLQIVDGKHIEYRKILKE